ncbi:MAG: chromosome segregation protein ScpA [wastewater metagenome]|nr:chromosome segregation protein ScpA [Candidatus Loosdrechtia aerotolerans]
MSNEYKVDLDVYNGPVDLLLYLIRREEVNIYDIPISRIADQYLQYVEAMQTLDMNIVGDFLVMATTLMYIKSYMLLPRTETQADEGEDDMDPRLSLVQQLLEYKRYKESTFLLESRASEWEKKVRRMYRVIPKETDTGEISLEGISIWDLFQRFSRLMKQTMSDIDTKVTYDDTPIQEYMNWILEKIQLHTSVSFTGLFQGVCERIRIIGFFLALLELVRLKRVKLEQSADHEDIQISINDSYGDRIEIFGKE